MSMNYRRKRRLLLGALATMALVAITVLPSTVTAAPTKIYDLEVTPSSALAGTCTDFFVKMTNRTPGNSNPNSFSVTLPSSFTLCGTPSISGGTNPNASATVTPAGSTRVEVKFLDPVKTGQFVTIKIPAATPSSITGCSESFTWSASVFTGSNLSGDQFTLNNPGAAQRTTVLSCLQLRFVAGFAPTDTAVGTDMHVQVEVIAGGSRVTTFTGPITIAMVSGPGTLTGVGPFNAVNGVADFPNFQGDTTGDYTVRATSSGVAASDPASFTLFSSQLSCDDPPESFSMNGGGTTTIGFIDPDDCADVPFNFSYDRTTNTFTIEKNELTVGLAVTVQWPPEVVPTGGDPNPLQITPTLVTPPTPFHPVEWCLGDGSATDPWDPPGNESWCIFSQSAENLGPGVGGQLMQVTDHLVLFGDANGRR